MSVLLALDSVVLSRPVPTVDSHGWVENATTEVWTGLGNLQVGSPTSGPLATESGGDGPFRPDHRATSVLYLPPEVTPKPGDVATVRGRDWVLNSVQDAIDPRGQGGLLDVWVCQVGEVPDGPA